MFKETFLQDVFVLLAEFVAFGGLLILVAYVTEKVLKR